MKKAAVALVVSLLAFSVVAAGCISSSSNTSSSGITLVVITRHDTTITYMAKEMFLKSQLAKEYHIANIKFIPVAEAMWYSYVKEGADVGWGGGPTLFDQLYMKGLLAPITNKKILGLLNTQIPTQLAGQPMILKKNGSVYWIASAVSSFGFTVNKQVLKKYNLPFPTTWQDVANYTWARNPPQYGIADPTKSTSNTRIYQIILQAFGWEKGWRIMTLIAANSRVYEASDAVRDAVINGQIAAGNTIDFYGYTAMKKNPNCVYVIPKGQSIINGDPIALLKYSKHPQAAQAFIYWVLTQGQALWMSPNINRLPANPKVFNYTVTSDWAKVLGLSSSDVGKTFGQARPVLLKNYEAATKAQGIPFNGTEALDTVNSLQEYFKATLVDENGPLHNAWIAVVQAYNNKKITKKQFLQLENELTAPITFKDPKTGKMVTFTEQYAKSINNDFSNPSFLNEIMNEWRQAASNKYNKVLSDLKKMEGS
ncbi:MAG: ABC transporter substrate-binding protein [Thermococci archaeon]|nr:ABC transporter substrate-binding protein [Thermococci archaeon]